MSAPPDRSRPAPAETDWAALRLAARIMAERAYAPYSQVHVGAAGVADDGRLVQGCNVENASYGLSLCAECGLVSNLVASGGGRLVAISVVAGDGAYLAPCGRCRQLLWEVGGPDLLVDTGSGPVSLAELLPGAFTPEDVEERADEDGSGGPGEVDEDDEDDDGVAASVLDDDESLFEEP